MDTGSALRVAATPRVSALSTAAAPPATPTRALRLAWPSASTFNLRSKQSARRVRAGRRKHETELQQLRTCLPGGMEPRHRRAALRIQGKVGGTRTGAGGRRSHDETAERLRAGDAAFSEGQGSVRGRECTASVVLRALFIHIAETGRAVRPVCRGQPPGTDDGRLNTYI